jgi:hypothetical protein
MTRAYQGCLSDFAVCSGVISSSDPSLPNDASEGDVRLVSGTNSSNGRLEIYYNGSWGTVCNKGFDNNDAQVVCNQLGLGKSSSVAYDGLGGSRNMWLESVECSGHEYRLTFCSHSDWGSVTCLDGHPVKIYCSKFSRYRFMCDSQEQITD